MNKILIFAVLGYVLYYGFIIVKDMFFTKENIVKNDDGKIFTIQTEDEMETEPKEEIEDDFENQKELLKKK